MAFSFDAGSDTGNTAAILDLLATRHITASFGLTGGWASANPGLVRRIAADGHDVINHTADHRSFTGFSTSTAALSRAERTRELETADATLSTLIGHTTRPWFRPPYGDLDDGAAQDAADAGFPQIAMWSIDSLGWRGLTPTEVTSRCLTGAGAGVIYLFHVGSASTDAAALSDVIDGLRAKGYEIGSVLNVLS